METNNRQHGGALAVISRWPTVQLRFLSIKKPCFHLNTASENYVTDFNSLDKAVFFQPSAILSYSLQNPAAGIFIQD